MCGIGGKLSFGSPPDPKLAEQMNACMDHRGPDAAGVYANGPALLAHRRLSILDPSEAGHQPMANGDDTVHIVFNGEIYNYRELRSKVDHYSFHSETDTEILLHLYEEYGTDCLQYLRGMFAFAIWDENEQHLFVARDRLGQKPLFYRQDRDQFWFGSTLKAILADDTVPARPDIRAIYEYLTYQYVPSPRTGFKGIRSLEPGEYLVVDANGTHRDTYWSISFAEKSDASLSALLSRLKSKLREATRLRMRSDAPIGIFLSGGIDSSIVTALMSDIREDPVSTYSIGFDNREYDELEFARSVADMYGTDHHEYTVSPDSMDVLPELIEHYEMPFGDPSALPMYYVSKVASEDITVALGGDAGDENFGGYDRYSYDALTNISARIPRPLRQVGIATLSAVPDGVTNAMSPYPNYVKRVLKAANWESTKRYADIICHSTDDELAQIWDGPESEDELANLRDALHSADGPTRLDHVMQADLNTYLSDDLLVKVDRASMAHTLEVRSPFLDHELVEFAARIPAKYKWRFGKKKWILKQAFKDILPEKVVHRSKQGFGIPLNKWFRGELADFADENLTRLGTRDAYDADGLNTLLAAHCAGDTDNGYRIWDLVMLEKWYERYID